MSMSVHPLNHEGAAVRLREGQCDHEESARTIIQSGSAVHSETNMYFIGSAHWVTGVKLCHAGGKICNQCVVLTWECRPIQTTRYVPL